MTKNNLKYLFSFMVATGVILNSGTAMANDDFKITGNVQTRAEVDERDFNSKTSPYFFATMRTSIGVEKTLFEKLKFYAQVRDSRLFGESPNTLSSIKNLDLHQGYVSFNNMFDSPFSTQVGRFELNYGTQRFIGSVDWHYVARSFDGVKVNYANKDFFNFNVDFLGLMINSSTPYVANATPANYKSMSNADGKEVTMPNNQIYGFWSNAKFSPMAEVDLFAWLDDMKTTKTTIDTNTKTAGTLFTDKKQVTAGINYKGTYGPFSSLVEAAYQFGNQTVKDPVSGKVASNDNIGSYLASAQVFYSPLQELKFGLGADIISGDAGGKINSAFETLYGTNHLFYGYMDYFINVAGNTKNYGLNDFYFTSSWKRDDFPLSAFLNVHHMMANQALKTGENTFGQEVDLTLRYKVMEKTNLVLGGSVFVPGNIMTSEGFFGKSSNGFGYWAYSMITANF